MQEIELILCAFGATPEQIDRERNRIHETLSSGN